MNDKIKSLSPEEVKINSLVEQTMKDVAKLETDIGKMQTTGRLNLNYTPPGMQHDDSRQQSKDAEKLKGNAELFKTKAIEKTDEIIANLPSDEQQRLRQGAIAKLYPERTEVIRVEPQQHAHKNGASKFLKDEKLEQLGNERFSQFLRYKPEMGMDNTASHNRESRANKDER